MLFYSIICIGRPNNSSEWCVCVYAAELDTCQLNSSLMFTHAKAVTGECPGLWNEICVWVALQPTLLQRWPFTAWIKRGRKWSSRKGNSQHAEVEKKWLYIINGISLQVSHARRNVIISDQTVSSPSFTQPCGCMPLQIHAVLTTSHAFKENKQGTNIVFYGMCLRLGPLSATTGFIFTIANQSF